MSLLQSQRTAIALLVVTLCAIYLPDIGHGFITDDFRWIAVGRVSDVSELPKLLTAEVGFYRPLVLATFSANYALSGLHAFPFALTNLALFFACAFLIVRVSRALGLSDVAALTAAAVWCFNFHGVSAALLWISGRTALLLCLFALLAAIATLRKQSWLAAFWCLLALLSKEEAVTVPFFLAGWSWMTDAPGERWQVFRRMWPMFAALGIYLVLRMNSDAFWPGDAPSYYRFVFTPARVLKNAVSILTVRQPWLLRSRRSCSWLSGPPPRWTRPRAGPCDSPGSGSCQDSRSRCFFRCDRTCTH